MKTIRPVLALALALALVAGACSDDDDTPTAAEIAAEARENAEKAKERAEDVADKGKEVADDVADGPDEGKVALEILEPNDGIRVPGNSFSMKFRSTGLTITTADGTQTDTSGHFHIFRDQEPPAVGEVIPATVGIVHSGKNPVQLVGQPVGRHTYTVVYGDGNHRRIHAGIEDRVTLTIEGPSVQGHFLTTESSSADQSASTDVVPANKELQIEVNVEGFTLAPADGKKTPGVGHLHFFIDRNPTPLGEPVPQGEGIIHTAERITKIPPLKPGTHAIWIVVGDGTHVPFAPVVLDKMEATAR